VCVYGVLSAISIATKLNKLTFNYLFFLFYDKMLLNLPRVRIHESLNCKTGHGLRHFFQTKK